MAEIVEVILRFVLMLLNVGSEDRKRRSKTAEIQKAEEERRERIRTAPESEAQREIRRTKQREKNIEGARLWEEKLAKSAILLAAIAKDKADKATARETKKKEAEIRRVRAEERRLQEEDSRQRNEVELRKWLFGKMESQPITDEDMTAILGEIQSRPSIYKHKVKNAPRKLLTNLIEAIQIFNPVYQYGEHTSLPARIQYLKDLVRNDQAKAERYCGSYGLPNDGRGVEGKTGTDVPRPSQYVRHALEEISGRSPVLCEHFEDRKDWLDRKNGFLFNSIWDFVMAMAHSENEAIWLEASKQWNRREIMDEFLRRKHNKPDNAHEIRVREMKQQVLDECLRKNDPQTESLVEPRTVPEEEAKKIIR